MINVSCNVFSVRFLHRDSTAKASGDADLLKRQDIVKKVQKSLSQGSTE